MLLPHEGNETDPCHSTTDKTLKQRNWKEKVDPGTTPGTHGQCRYVQTASDLNTIFTGHEASSTSSGLRHVKGDYL